MMAEMGVRIRQKAKAIMFKSLPMMIDCRAFEEFLIDYFEDALPKRQRRVFEMHLKLCRECREYLAAFKRTLELSKHAFDDPEAPTPSDVPEDLVRAIIAARKA